MWHFAGVDLEFDLLESRAVLHDPVGVLGKGGLL
jgi:hypothetical protein